MQLTSIIGILFALVTLVGCGENETTSTVEPLVKEEARIKNFGQFDGFDLLDPTVTDYDPASHYLALSHGLSQVKFEFFIEDRLVLAGSTSEELETFANLSGPVIVKRLENLPKKFQVRVTIAGKQVIDEELDRSAGRILTIERFSQQNRTRLHQTDGLVYE